MSVVSSFAVVLERLRRGEEDAATEVYRRFAGRLMAVARERLNPLLRRKADPEDIIQSAYGSFFYHLADGEYELRNWSSLWGVLLLIVTRRCCRLARRYNADKRDLHNEVAVAGGDDWSDRIPLPGREPSPEDAAVLADLLDKLLRSLPDDRDREILQLRLQGCTVAEIGERVGYTRGTVRGVLDTIRKRCEGLQDGD